MPVTGFQEGTVQIISSYTEREASIVVPSGTGLNGEDAASKMVILMTLFGDSVIWMRKICFSLGFRSDLIKNTNLGNSFGY